MKDIRTMTFLILKKYARDYDDCIHPINFGDIADDVKQVFDNENKTIYQT